MQNQTLLFPDFHLQTLRRKPQTPQQRLVKELDRLKQKSLTQLSDCFEKFVPSHMLSPASSGAMSRRRVFSKENTFWAFLSQALDADGGCQEVVRKLQAYAAMKQQSLPSSSTAAYCQARKRLDTDSLSAILHHTSERLETMPTRRWLHERRVIVVDGTGISMPDTDENQAVWPQQRHQKPGCGFPQATLCACFCLHTGALLSYRMGNKNSHELPLLREQWNTFKSGDVFLGDKGFCSYFDIVRLKERGVDSVITLARRLPITEAESISVLGKDDLLIQWKKPAKNKASSYSRAEWESLPETLTLRQIKVTVSHPGFRTASFYLITTLKDDKAYPTSEIADLYLQRWDVELYFRDIKTTMGMDILRCKTPEMICKEIIMHLIAYNCIRFLMLESASRKTVVPRRISFKGTVQALRQWEPFLCQSNSQHQEMKRLLELLHESIAGNIIRERPGRSEPRAVKRRPKPFQLLTRHRHEMKETPHRGKHHAKVA